MDAGRYPEYEQLAAKVADALRRLVDLTTASLGAYRNSNQTEFMKIDKELENTVGEKERAIGALRQHAKEHGCHSENTHIRSPW